jgi:Lon protease-like protein
LISFPANLSERNFGLVCKKSDGDNSTYKVGILVKVIEQETFFSSMFSKSTIEILVEGVNRFKLEKVYSNVPPMSTCKVQVYDDEKGKAAVGVYSFYSQY